MIQYVYVQLALLRQASECQVAAPKEADARIDWIGTEKEVEICVERMPQEELYRDPFFLIWFAKRRRPFSSASVGTPSVSCVLNSSASVLRNRIAVCGPRVRMLSR